MKAQLIESMGSDLTVVNAARVSFSKESELIRTDTNTYEQPKYGLAEADAKLINYLAKHDHWTPFSHPQIMMREKVPIFVARQRFKHVVGFTYNEVSRRYVDDEPEFYTPDVWRSRPEGSVKQGSGGRSVDISGEFPLVDYGYNGDLSHYMYICTESYKSLLLAGVAPEQARMVLPQSMYTEYYVTGSLAAWARAYKQRIDDHAQKEIQDLAEQWGSIIQPLFPESWEALTKEPDA
jgi:thymidylate synthase (FAD)